MMQLHSRIFSLVLLMLLGLGSTSTLFLYQSTQHRTETDVADRLVLAGRSFIDTFENRQKNLFGSVQTVVNDWGLRQAIGQREKTTVESVLLNHSNRIGADIALFLDLDEKVYASTMGSEKNHFGDLTSLSMNAPSASLYRFVVIDGRCYQFVMAEVRAPVSVGWLGMGFLIDDELARHFSRLNDVGVSFVKNENGRRRIIGSSIGDSDRVAAGSAENGAPDAHWRISGTDWDDLVFHHTLVGDGSDLTVVLQKSLSEPLASFRSWWWSLFTIFALIVGLALLMAYVFARGITKPLTLLQTAVEDMEAGNYHTTIDVHRQDEIGFLSKAFARMQTAIADREDEIRYRADHDLVTEVHNRSGFVSGLEGEISQVRGTAATLVVFSFSVNHFKQIVDALGYNWGDRLLKMVADRLLSAFPDNLVAHVDSDEFAVFMASDEVVSPFSLAEKIHDCFKDGFTIRSISLSLNACVGITVFPEHADDPRNLLRRAGVALNEAIDNHRRTVVYDPDLDQNSVKRLTLMSELPNAIKAGQLDLHYQPKVRCTEKGGVLCGVESLVRWNHPELGWIAPDEFIGLAEKTGFIVELTRHVLRRAVAQCSQWQQRGLALTMSVNISALDLESDTFARDVQELLEEFDLPAAALCLEVTESTAMADPESSIDRLTALNRLGVRLSIDDYGTGYSSLAQLKKLPVNELKIDKSFVLELDRSSDDQTIVRSTIELAHNIGLEVVAEGVESERILWQLDKWGCEYVQGFHISKPLPLEEFESWLLQSPFFDKQISDAETVISQLGRGAGS